ncbi:hypothetical protein BY458DRAFT_501785 [Sporodiniella umbellata]|nr:hypothetical protein BY458DRAFT_501785 [Sporodiniella umbellata]
MENNTLLNEGESNKYNKNNWKTFFIWFWRFCIFGITGSSSVHVTRSLIRLTGCPEGTWYYYTFFFFLEFPVYTVMIVCIGSILFQWRFFCTVAFKMWSWSLPRKTKDWCAHRLYNESPILPV